jgi:peptidoglycan/xylan/chitin deacetylase (PgdA/CDA1 family)
MAIHDGVISKFRRAPRRLGRGLAKITPVEVLRRVLPESVVCPCYHMVSDVSAPHLQHYDFLTPDEFERDLQALERHFSYVSYDDIVEQTPRNSRGGMCLTFDDGFAECYSKVRPILMRRRASCIFFVITDLIDNQAVFLETQASLCVDALLRRSTEEVEAIVCDLALTARISAADEAFRKTAPPGMAQKWAKFERRLRPLLVWALTISPAEAPMLDRLARRLGVDAAAYVQEVKPYLSSEQILGLRSDGFTIGAHTCSHRLLSSLTREEAEWEIVESCRRIHELTGQPSVPFAFPYWGGGLDRVWLERLRQRHPFIGLFYDTQGLRRDAPFVVQRFFGERIDGEGSMERLLRRAWARKLS